MADIKTFYWWMEKASMKHSTEAEVCAGIVAGSNKQAGTAYTERHNQVTGILYRNIFAAYGLEIPMSQWDMPSKVAENTSTKFLWDF